MPLYAALASVRCWPGWVTHLSKYSPDNVPGSDTDKFSSLLCEVPYSNRSPIPANVVIEKCIQGLISSGVLTEADRQLIVSTHVIDCPYGYPIPTLDRDENLKKIVPWLEKRGILSRGRFGTWKYEVGNSDHAFMMGWTAAG